MCECVYPFCCNLPDVIVRRAQGNDQGGKVSSAAASPGFVSISVGTYVVCGLTAVGAVTCWGNAFTPTSAPTSGVFSFVTVGDGNGCALSGNGSVVTCWGRDDRGGGQMPNPTAGATLVAVSVGNANVCSITRTGALQCVGAEDYHDVTFPRLLPTTSIASVACGTSVTCVVVTPANTLTCSGQDASGQADPPVGSYTSVACGRDFCCGLFSGTITCFGNNNYGQAPGTISQNGNFAGVWCGDMSSVGITVSGGLVAWGLDLGTLPTGSGFVRASVGTYHACAWKSDGSIACFVNGGYSMPSPPAGPYLDIACSYRSSCGILAASGTITCWGANDDGQINSPGGAGFTLIYGSGSAKHYCALAGTALTCFGSNEFGQASAPAGAAFSSVALGAFHTCGVKTDATLLCWGSDSHLAVSAGGVTFAAACAAGEYGPPCTVCPVGSYCLPGVPRHALCPPNTYSASTGAVLCTACPASKLSGAAGATSVAACTLCPAGSFSDGAVCVACPAGTSGAGRAGSYADVCVRCAEGFTSAGGVAACAACATGCLYEPVSAGDTLVVGMYQTCVVDATNPLLRCVGDSGSGGNQGTDNVALTANWISVALSPVSDNFMCGVPSGAPSNAVCWGPNLPSGMTMNVFTQVAVGGVFMCGIQADGTLLCTGNNAGVPATLPGTWWQVACAGTYFCAIASTTFALKCVGQSLPDNVPTGAPFSQLSCGLNYCCGVSVSGAVSCWGGLVPPPATPRTFVQVAVGENFAYALTTTGRAVAFGSLTVSQGTLSESSYIAVVSGGYSACGVQAGSTVTCVGQNSGDHVSLSAAFFAAGPVTLYTVCPAGKDATVAGCGTDCPAGSFSVPNFRCEMCPPGMFQASAGAAWCVPCAPGTSSGAVGASSAAACAVCAAGTSAGAGASACVPCGAGQTSVAGAEACAFASATGARMLIETRWFHGCAVSSTGVPACWGYDGNQQTTTPVAKLGARVVSVSVGQYHSCMLGVDGAVWCFGNNMHNEYPKDALFTQVCSGRDFACGLNAVGGAMSCWPSLGWLANIPQGAFTQSGPDRFTQIACGDQILCGVRSTGIASCAGSGGVVFDVPVPLSFVAAGTSHVCGITVADRSILCWPTAGSTDARMSPPAGPFTTLACGSDHSCGIRAVTNDLVCW